MLFDKCFLEILLEGGLWFDFIFNSIYTTSKIFADRVLHDFPWPCGSSPEVLIRCDALSGGQWAEKHTHIFQNSDFLFSY